MWWSGGGRDISDCVSSPTQSLAMCAGRFRQQIVDRPAAGYVGGGHDDDACLLAVRGG
ncbi:hypothetical protein [Streptomyces xantholiticus]|uniref:hypothetical protein n=1 Tax=Streptomyces xantholiticus TaxID=68285 RepID=UPI0016770025|nr:hypothetical protein [Streptomyces xantholiticus]